MPKEENLQKHKPQKFLKNDTAKHIFLLKQIPLKSTTFTLQNSKIQNDTDKKIKVYSYPTQALNIVKNNSL